MCLTVPWLAFFQVSIRAKLCLWCLYEPKTSDNFILDVVCAVLYLHPHVSAIFENLRISDRILKIKSAQLKIFGCTSQRFFLISQTHDVICFLWLHYYFHFHGRLCARSRGFKDFIVICINTINSDFHAEKKKEKRLARQHVHSIQSCYHTHTHTQLE